MGNKQKPRRITRPVIKQEIVLGSFPAQKSFNRSYVFTSRSLYLLAVVLRPLTSEKNVSEVEEKVDELLSEMEVRFADEVKRLIALCNKTGIDPQPNFTQPLTVDVEISTPRASRYLGLIKQLDHIIGLIAILWISGVRTDKQYSNECYLWQRNLARLSNRMCEIIKRAIAAGNQEKNQRAVAAKHAEFQPGLHPQEALNDSDAIELASTEEVDGNQKDESEQEVLDDGEAIEMSSTEEVGGNQEDESEQEALIDSKAIEIASTIEVSENKKDASEKEPTKPKVKIKRKPTKKKIADKTEEDPSGTDDKAQVDAASSPAQA